MYIHIIIKTFIIVMLQYIMLMWFIIIINKCIILLFILFIFKIVSKTNKYINHFSWQIKGTSALN